MTSSCETIHSRSIENFDHIHHMRWILKLTTLFRARSVTKLMSVFWTRACQIEIISTSRHNRHRGIWYLNLMWELCGHHSVIPCGTKALSQAMISFFNLIKSTLYFSDVIWLSTHRVPACIVVFIQILFMHVIKKISKLRVDYNAVMCLMNSGFSLIVYISASINELMHLGPFH